MRYRDDGTVPDPSIPYGESMHSMLTLSLYLAIVIGICLFIAGRRGQVLWLTVWSIGLVICSVVILVGESLGIV